MFEQQIERVHALIAGLIATGGGDKTIGVTCFDQVVSRIYEGPASGFGEAQIGAMRSRGSGRAAGRARPRSSPGSEAA